MKIKPKAVATITLRMLENSNIKERELFSTDMQSSKPTVVVSVRTFSSNHSPTLFPNKPFKKPSKKDTVEVAKSKANKFKAAYWLATMVIKIAESSKTFSQRTHS